MPAASPRDRHSAPLVKWLAVQTTVGKLQLAAAQDCRQPDFAGQEVPGISLAESLCRDTTLKLDAREGFLRRSARSES